MTRRCYSSLPSLRTTASRTLLTNAAALENTRETERCEISTVCSLTRYGVRAWRVMQPTHTHTHRQAFFFGVYPPLFGSHLIAWVLTLFSLCNMIGMWRSAVCATRRLTDVSTHGSIVPLRPNQRGSWSAGGIRLHGNCTCGWHRAWRSVGLLRCRSASTCLEGEGASVDRFAHSRSCVRSGCILFRWRRSVSAMQV